MKRRNGLNFSRRRRKFNMPLFKEVMSWVIECAIVIFIAYTLVTFFGCRTTVVGNAMNDTLTNEEQILVNRFVYNVSSPKQGDVIAFLPNGNEKSHYYVRRVVACPGDTVQIKDGKVYVNGEVYQEKIMVASIEDAGVASEEIKLGDDEYFVLGDNRNNSEDSRLANIGNVKKSYIIGKAWFYFKSIGNMGFAEGKCAFFEQLKMPLSAFQEADEWNYDVYAYNASPALQAILARNILQMEHTLGQEFDEVKKETIPAGRYQILEAEALTDSEILKNEERPVVWDEPREGILLREGDLALTLHKGQFHFIPVGKGEEYVAGKGVFGLRMKGWYTPWFLKLYLDGPVGRLFLETMRSGETYAFSMSRLLRVPLPVSDRQKMEDITETAAKAVSRLAEAEQNWRRVKRESVDMMMGHPTL